MATQDVSSIAGPFGFVFHQVAMYTPDVDASVKAYQSLGYGEWSRDTAMLNGYRIINGHWQPVASTAIMAFNYQVMPMELEFLQYLDGAHRHEERALLTRVPFISHMSVHVKSVVKTMQVMKDALNLFPYHLFQTSAHTNPHVAGKKRFIECIYDTRDVFGYDIKCIERIPWDAPFMIEDILRSPLVAT